MLTPETILTGLDEESSLKLLSKIFRRYSRCDDILLSPEAHVKAIKQRFCVMFNRSADRPILFDRLRKTIWVISELTQQVKTGKPSNVDLGLRDQSIVSEIFYSQRTNTKPQVSSELELRRA
jgi:hypothetical protein